MIASLTSGSNLFAAVVLWGVFVYYLFFAWALRFRWRRPSVMTVYEPPPKVSPTLAAYFLHAADPAISLTVCLVDLTQRGAIRLQPGQGGGYYVETGKDLVELRDFERQLREQICECPLTPRAVRDASDLLDALLEGQVVPRYLSPHTLLSVIPLVVSGVVALQILAPYLDRTGRLGIAFLMFAAGLCYWAGISLEAFGTKINSWVPGHRGPRLPLQVSDLRAIWVTVVAIVCFCVIATVTKAWPLLICAGLAGVNMFGRSLLRTPTREGWALYDRLQGFRAFLSAVEADPMNVLNAPTEMPKKIHDNLAYAVAFDLEHSWGEQLRLFITQELVTIKPEMVARVAGEGLAGREWPS